MWGLWVWLARDLRARIVLRLLMTQAREVMCILVLLKAGSVQSFVIWKALFSRRDKLPAYVK